MLRHKSLRNKERSVATHVVTATASQSIEEREITTSHTAKRRSSEVSKIAQMQLSVAMSNLEREPRGARKVREVREAKEVREVKEVKEEDETTAVDATIIVVALAESLSNRVATKSSDQKPLTTIRSNK